MSYTPTNLRRWQRGSDYMGAIFPDWFVAPCQVNRDSDVLERSNWATQAVALPESETVQVHRFGHWACGWVELLLIHESDTEALRKADELAARLANYPLLDEELHSNMEHAEACEWWENMGISGRVEMCQRSGISVFAARREDLSTVEDPSGRLYDLLRSN